MNARKRLYNYNNKWNDCDHKRAFCAIHNHTYIVLHTAQERFHLFEIFRRRKSIRSNWIELFSQLFTQTHHVVRTMCAMRMLLRVLRVCVSTSSKIEEKNIKMHKQWHVTHRWCYSLHTHDVCSTVASGNSLLHHTIRVCAHRVYAVSQCHRMCEVIKIALKL